MDIEHIRTLRDIVRKFDRELFFQNVASCCNGISPAQCHALLEIERLGKTTVGELAQNLALDKSTVSRTIDGLVNISLIDRVIPKENRRMSVVSLTEAGQKVCKTINYTNDGYFESVLCQFSDDEISEIIRLFAKFTSGMKDNRLSEVGKCCG